MTGPEGDGRRGVAVLGSTGSIGRQALDVLWTLRSRFRVVALASRAPSPRLRDQIARFRPDLLALAEDTPIPWKAETAVVRGSDGLIAAATHPAVEIVLVATSGHAAIVPTLRAIESGKIIALANKEALVCAGELIIPLAARKAIPIRPVDSEHSAIWQALAGAPIEQVRRILITASGGPFRATPRTALQTVTAQQALAHPTWSMGGKITIDSATLMNKGLEIIEAHWLFGLSYDRIDVLVHPESIVHSLVEFIDGGFMAQLGLPDMKLPIQYALTYPERLPVAAKRLDLAAVGALRFAPPDETRFPALRLAREAGLAGRTYPTALSAADDEAVAAFLRDDLRFLDIPAVVESVLARHEPAPVSIDAILASDRWARAIAREEIAKRARA